ncbi:MAG TPA: PfkB family carbohydrate kinase, partial [Chloroflexota bacterium]|nr:PfkB family carbohydrate kinase [Chloroflexota bacterium]
MIPTKQRLTELIDRLASVRLLVVGDLVADEYLLGRPARLSREAPIPILELTRRYFLPGAAGNAARNAADLGAQVAVVGVVGSDEAGDELCRQFVQAGIRVDGVITDPERHTSTKTRIIGGDEQTMPQQLARIDNIDGRLLDGAINSQIAMHAVRLLVDSDVLLLSDYDIAAINADVISALLPVAHKRSCRVVVDAHDQFARFRGVHAATPNQPEAEAEVGHSLAGDDALHRGAATLVERMDAEAALITRGGLGMALHERGGPTHLIPVATYSEVRDATGAGDTAATVYTLAVAGGATPLEAAHLANLAAGVAVCKLGVATVTAAELRQA